MQWKTASTPSSSRSSSAVSPASPAMTRADGVPGTGFSLRRMIATSWPASMSCCAMAEPIWPAPVIRYFMTTP